jgi:gamma-glutamylcyclotransferase (GGCT)/AIG2-like uncharacterized protein YtfP
VRSKLFFYGSLKRGYENHFRLAGQEFLGEAVTEPFYRIVAVGGWGGLVRDEAGGFSVSGELYLVDAECLARLDEFECGEGPWRRLSVDIAGHVGVESYLYTGEVPPDALSGGSWPFK